MPSIRQESSWPPRSSPDIPSKSSKTRQETSHLVTRGIIIEIISTARANKRAKRAKLRFNPSIDRSL